MMAEQKFSAKIIRYKFAHQLFRPSVCEVQPIRRKFDCLFQSEEELRICTDAQYSSNKDYFGLRIMQRYSKRDTHPTLFHHLPIKPLTKTARPDFNLSGDPF